MVVWPLNGPNISSWESETKPKRLPWEDFHLCKQKKEVEVEEKKEDPILLFEDLPSFLEEEEEEKVVPSLEEQIMDFKPLHKS